MSAMPVNLTLGSLQIGTPSNKSKDHGPGPQLVAVQPTLAPTQAAAVPSSMVPTAGPVLSGAAPALAPAVAAPAGPSSGTPQQVLAGSSTAQPLEQALLGAGSTPPPAGAGGTGHPGTLTPAQQANLTAGMAYAQAHSSLQAPIDPSGQPSTLGQAYWVPNGMTIADVTGYTRPQVGTGLFTGEAGEPGAPGYMGIGYVPAGWLPS